MIGMSLLFFVKLCLLTVPEVLMFLVVFARPGGFFYLPELRVR